MIQARQGERSLARPAPACRRLPLPKETRVSLSKTAWLLACLHIVLLSQLAPGQTTQPEEAHSMNTPQLRPSAPLVILAWGSPSIGEDFGRRYQEFAEAGYAHGLAFAGDVGQYRRILDGAQAAGATIELHLPRSS